jgi:flagellar capping protein FliD
MTSSLENNTSVDELRDDSITPEYDKLVNEFASLSAQIDAVDNDLSTQFSTLL